MTVKEHLARQLVPQIFELAINNCIEQGREKNLEIDIDNLTNCIQKLSFIINGRTLNSKDCINCFSWKESNEGFEFWQNVSKMIKTYNL